MAFPSTPLDIRTELKLDGVWTDISGDVYVRDFKEIDAGRRDMGARTDPGELTLTLNNRSGQFSTRNPQSPLWGLLGPNTGVRVSVPGTTHYLELTGATDTLVSTPGHAALDITGDLDLRWEGEANWYGPGAQFLLAKWGAAGQRSYHMRLQDGSLYLHLGRDGTSGPNGFWELPVLPQRAALRATIEDGETIRFYSASSITGPWTQFGSDITLTSPLTTGIFVSTAPLTIAPSQLDVTPPRRPVDGKVYKAEVRDGISGTLVAAPDFEAQPAGTADFTDPAGRVWSYSGSARISDRAYRFTGEISTWPKKWQPDGSDVWCSVVAAGVLRRYDQGTKALNSTLRRRIPSGSPDAYWPFEEDSLASRAYSPVPGVTAAAVTGVEWAGVDTLPSSKALPRLTEAATLSAIVPDTANDGEWQVEFVYNADDKTPPSSGDHAEVISISTTGTIRRWVIGMRSGTARIWGFDASGTDIAFKSIGVGGDVFHGWVRLRLWARDAGGGTMEYRIAWQDVGGEQGGITYTQTGAPGRVTAVTANWGALTEGWAFGHLSVLPVADSALYTGSDDGYSGETAWERMRRLASEENIPMARIPGRLTPERVGAQRPEELLELLHTAAEADGGMLLEDRDRPGLVYRERSSLYTQEPALILDATQPGLDDEDMNPAEEADFVRNDITVKRTSGSEGRAVLTGGKYGTTRFGVYDTAPELSLDADTQTEPIAHWLLHLLTYDGARYPAVTVMLHKPGAQTLMPAILALREGDLIRITNLPTYVEYGHLDLIVQGWHEELDLYRWEVTFNCSPGGPWRLATTNVIHEGFEDNTYDVTITDGGTLPWTRTSAQAHSGTYSLRSGAISNNQTSDAALLLPAAAASLSFWYRTSSEASGAGFEGDRLLVLVDGAEVLRAQGAVGWTQFTTDVAGKSAVVFRYAKDNSAASGEDAVYIDDLRLIVGSHAPAKADTDGSSLAVALTTTATTMAVVSEGQPWTEDPAEMPIPLEVGGEQVTCTAITAVSDTFTRTVSGGWGTADTGQAWTTVGGTAGTDYAVTSGTGRHIHTSVNTFRHTVIPALTADVDLTVDWAMSAQPVGDSNYVFVMARYADTTHFYFARVQVATTGAMTLTLRKRNGAETQLGSSFATGLTHVPGTWYSIRFEAAGSTIRAKVWVRGTTEPASWQLSTTDTDLTAVGSIGFRSLLGSASTATLPVTIEADNFHRGGPQFMTVTRSVNGVVKTHPVGEAVSLAYPAIASL